MSIMLRRTTMENEKGLFGKDVNVAQPIPRGMLEAGIRKAR